MYEHVISDQLLDLAKSAIARGRIHIAYNTISYFLDDSTMYFFKTNDEAHEFAANNISDYDNYKVIQAKSVDELLQQINYGENLRIQLITTKNNLPMNEKNYDDLARKLKFTDFGEDLLPALKKKMEIDEKEFTLTLQRNYEKDETVATLQFRRSDNDIVYFNRYSLVLKNEQHPDAIKQTFFIANNPSDISMKQAYNLLCGRAIYKEGLQNREKQEYKAWLQLDFKVSDAHGNYKLHPYNEKYGFDLEKALYVHSIKEMSEAVSRERLIESLQRGNRQAVTMTVQGAERKLFIEAAPRFKSLNIYNETGMRLKPEDLYLKQGVTVSQKQDVKQKQSRKAGDDDLEGKPGKRKQRQRIS